jgi:trehalose/maltose transport system substrate-binding protein
VSGAEAVQHQTFELCYEVRVQFTQETGIRVKNIPIAEYTNNYLDLARKLVADSSGPDLLNIDLVWSPILEPDLIDLRPYLAAEIPQLDPQLLPSYP